MDSHHLWASKIVLRCGQVGGHRLSNPVGLIEGSWMTVRHWVQAPDPHRPQRMFPGTMGCQMMTPSPQRPQDSFWVWPGCWAQTPKPHGPQQGFLDDHRLLGADFLVFVSLCFILNIFLLTYTDIFILSIIFSSMSEFPIFFENSFVSIPFQICSEKLYVAYFFSFYSNRSQQSQIILI